MITDLERAISPSAYRELFEGIVASGEAYGPSVDYGADYTKLNLARSRRIERTLKIAPELRKLLEEAAPQTWLVITEPWCGDSAQSLPIIEALAGASNGIELRLLLRDTNLDVMDRYLTNGSRSIPKLVAFDQAGKELFQWGPRPAAAQDLVMGNKTMPEDQRLGKEALAEALHRWYFEDQGESVMRELGALLERVQA